jgi:hypothetical protein
MKVCEKCPWVIISAKFKFGIYDFRTASEKKSAAMKLFYKLYPTKLERKIKLYLDVEKSYKALRRETNDAKRTKERANTADSASKARCRKYSAS